MTREIKFRAWDKENKKMVEPQVVLMSENDRQTGLNKIIKGFGDNLMQFTGLKDKNGKEIYEGDIVKGSLAWDKEVKNHKVYFDKDEYGYMPFLNRQETCEGEDHLSSYMCEVIGNIYQDSHLLENK
ncbi:MAG TPA: hypothetical protein ENI23_02045 [bacterium]|nr:hypothetical protein [bacterium]